MKAADYRNATWAELQRSGLTGMRSRVYYAWLQHGPGTTEQVAQAAGISILTFRPRTTELYQIGLVEVVPGAGCRVESAGFRGPSAEKGRQRATHEGVYRAVGREVWEARAVLRKAERQEQMALPLRA